MTELDETTNIYDKDKNATPYNGGGFESSVMVPVMVSVSFAGNTGTVAWCGEVWTPSQSGEVRCVHAKTN